MWLSSSGLRLTTFWPTRRTRRVWWVYVGTVTFLVAFAVLVVGLTLGSVRLQEQRLSQDRRATYLLLNPRPGHSLTAEAINQIQSAVRARFPEASELQVYPYSTLSWDWHDTGRRDYRLRFRGRTLAAGDPLLLTEPRSHGRVFERPNESGVLLTEDMLQELSGKGEPVPEQLYVTLNVRPEPVPVVGVLTRQLPGNFDFVVTEQTAEMLALRNPNPQASEVYSGRLPPAWADLEKLPVEASGIMSGARPWSKAHVEWVGPRRRGDGWVWMFQARKKPYPRLDQWKLMLVELRAVLPTAGISNDQFCLPEPVTTEPEVPSEPSTYDRVGVYLGRLSDLDRKLDAVLETTTKQGLDHNPDTVAQLRPLLRAGNKAHLTLTVLLAILLVLAVGNLYVVHDLRAGQKVTEVGMLKAMGMSHSLLRWIYLTEGLLVWLVGSTVGVVAGLGGGRWLVDVWIVDHPEESGVAFACPPVWLLGILLGSAAVSLGSIWFATLKARRASAMKSLAGG